MDDGDDVDVELQGRVSFLSTSNNAISVAYRIKEILSEQFF